MNLPDRIAEVLSAQPTSPIEASASSRRLVEAAFDTPPSRALQRAIAGVRASVAGIVRIHLDRPQRKKKGKVLPPRYVACMTGTAFCVVEDKHLVTAFHVFNGGQPRDPQDTFYAVFAPDNGDQLLTIPVASFPVERPDLDIAVLELRSSDGNPPGIPALHVSFAEQEDGNRVVTMGFPGARVVSFGVDLHGNLAGGQFALRRHANEGIVSSHYADDVSPLYELNVGWHHGESGGPIATVSDQPPAAFSLMQCYRDIDTPHGVMPGPHCGRSLAAIEKELRDLGVKVV